MDKKDEIILQQLDVIRSMTERNLRSMNARISGARPCPRRTKRRKKAPNKTPEKPRTRSPAARSRLRRRPRSRCPRRT